MSTAYLPDFSEEDFDVFRKTTSGSSDTYVVSAVNGTQLAEYNGMSDFTADGGEGAPDFEMLTI
jgi:hypothetical protein